MFSSVGSWYYKALAGIDHYNESSSGFDHIVINPSVVAGLYGVNGNLSTPTKDMISSSWRRYGGPLCASAPEVILEQSREYSKYS